MSSSESILAMMTSSKLNKGLSYKFQHLDAQRQEKNSLLGCWHDRLFRDFLKTVLRGFPGYSYFYYINFDVHIDLK